MTPSFVVSQIGAREHYAIPRALHAAGCLTHLYTDAWAPPCQPLWAILPGPVAMLASRFHPDIPRAKTTAFTASTLRRNLTSARRETSVEAGFLRHAAIGRDFCRRVNRTLPRHIKAGDVFFGYDTGCLETLALVRDLGARSIVDQIDPARVEQDIVLEECARFPGWQAIPGRIPDAYFDRLAAEWTAADRVVVNSRWSRDALVKQGVPMGKIAILPLAYESPAALPQRAPRAPGAPLRVLFLGQVILRKGVQYLFEAARLLLGENITFTLAGPLGISEKALATMPANMRYIGRVPRERTAATYLTHDVFVLPTLSDGFAITQLEAMAHGLPVIATPCCGDVVQHGQNGLIIPPRDAPALANMLASIVATPGLWDALTANARQMIPAYSLEKLGAHLLATDVCAKP